MIPKEAIEKAIVGGWSKDRAKYFFWQMTALDPSFWRCLGKASGWTARMTKEEGPLFCRIVLLCGDLEAYWKELLKI